MRSTHKGYTYFDVRKILNSYHRCWDLKLQPLAYESHALITILNLQMKLKGTTVDEVCPIISRPI